MFELYNTLVLNLKVICIVNRTPSHKNHKMKIKKNIALSDTGFVFNPGSGDSFSVNPIGLEIMKLLQVNKTHEEIKKHLLETYSVDKDTIEKDIYDFTKMLEQFKLSEQDEKKES